MPVQRSLAFSSERMRELLWRDVSLPAGLLDKTLVRLNEQLDATKVEYFTHQGLVISRRRVVDNAARQGAIDKVLSMTGSYVREKDSNRNESQTVTIEIGDDGVHRIIIGAVGAPHAALPLDREVIDVDIQPRNDSVAVTASDMSPAPRASSNANGVDDDAYALTAALEAFRVPLDADAHARSAMFAEPDTPGNGTIP